MGEGSDPLHTTRDVGYIAGRGIFFFYVSATWLWSWEGQTSPPPPPVLWFHEGQCNKIFKPRRLIILKENAQGNVAVFPWIFILENYTCKSKWYAHSLKNRGDKEDIFEIRFISFDPSILKYLKNNCWY